MYQAITQDPTITLIQVGKGQQEIAQGRLNRSVAYEPSSLSTFGALEMLAQHKLGGMKRRSGPVTYISDPVVIINSGCGEIGEDERSFLENNY